MVNVAFLTLTFDATSEDSSPVTEYTPSSKSQTYLYPSEKLKAPSYTTFSFSFLISIGMSYPRIVFPLSSSNDRIFISSPLLAVWSMKFNFTCEDIGVTPSYQISYEFAPSILLFLR